MKQFTHSTKAFYLDEDDYLYDYDNDRGIVLYVEMDSWFEENDISYELMWAHRDNGDFSAAIKFHKEEDALAFKLRWS